MPKYKLNKQHYLGDRLRHAGETVDWDGPPSLSMVPADAAATKAKETWDADRKQRQSTRKSIGWSPGLQQHQWNQLTRPDPSLVGADGQSASPTANINVVGQVKRGPGRPRSSAAAE